jgi:hypothetical protein
VLPNARVRLSPLAKVSLQAGLGQTAVVRMAAIASWIVVAVIALGACAAVFWQAFMRRSIGWLLHGVSRWQ